MNPDKRLEISETRQCKIILPGSLNDHKTLFGGELLRWMDEVAYITAIRYCRQEMVTVSAEHISFRQPLPEGTIIELTGKVVKTGNATITVAVEVRSETFQSDDRSLVTEGSFRFAAIDSGHKLIRISPPQD